MKNVIPSSTRLKYHLLYAVMDTAVPKTKLKYRAPALEKGLDILELLSSAKTPLNSNQIAKQLGRSKDELYRMLQVLEAREYVERIDDGESFIVTKKLLTLGIERQPMANLYEFSLPVMRELSEDTEQSCHLAIQSGSDLVVVARAEAPGSITYSVRVGYRQPFLGTSSGRLIYALQNDTSQTQMRKIFNPIINTAQELKLEKDVKKIRKQNFWIAKSIFVTGVIDISAPIDCKGEIIAALTIPFIHRIGDEGSMDQCRRKLVEAAANISASLNDGYVKPL